MSDPSLATRAPESDLQDESLDDDDRAPLPTPSQPQASLSDHCTTDRPLPTNTLTDSPSGTLTKWHLSTTNTETEIYISKPNDYPTTPARLLLLFTNGTGIHSRNNQHQADMFARAGYLTLMPDLFAGDPAPNSKPEEHGLARDATWLDTVKLKVAETAKSFGLDMWLARQTEEKILPVLRGVLSGAKEEFADAIAHGGGIYAVGYCFGGRYVLILAGDGPGGATEGEAEEGQGSRGPEIKAGVCAHGTLVGREDLRGVRAPVQLICVEEDPLFPGEVLEEGRKWLQENKVDHEIEVYKDVPHGFAVVGEYESSAINEAQSKAFDGMVRWLNAH